MLVTGELVEKDSSRVHPSLVKVLGTAVDESLVGHLLWTVAMGFGICSLVY